MPPSANGSLAVVELPFEREYDGLFEQLVRRTEALEDFAALVAHELKTPLQAALLADDPSKPVEEALDLVDELLEAAQDAPRERLFTSVAECLDQALLCNRAFRLLIERRAALANRAVDDREVRLKHLRGVVVERRAFFHGDALEPGDRGRVLLFDECEVGRVHRRRLVREIRRRNAIARHGRQT